MQSSKELHLASEPLVLEPCYRLYGLYLPLLYHNNVDVSRNGKINYAPSKEFELIDINRYCGSLYTHSSYGNSKKNFATPRELCCIL